MKEKISHKNLEFQIPLKNQSHGKMDVPSIRQLMTGARHALNLPHSPTVSVSPQPGSQEPSVTLYSLLDCWCFFPS